VPNAGRSNPAHHAQALRHLRLLGSWTASALAVAPQWHALQAMLKAWPAPAPLAASSPSASSLTSASSGGPLPLHWDLSGLTALDHVGAQVLWAHWGKQYPGHLTATDAQRKLLARVAHFSSTTAPTPPTGLLRHWDALGEQVMHALSHLHTFTLLLGQLLLDLLQLLRAPRRGPWRDVSGHVFNFGATAMPITALVGFLIGVVLAYLSAQQLRQFGADAFIVDLLGVSLVRELGPMLAAILIAGRSGSAITAQIGVMRVTQELDAMRVMGIAPGFRLVMPRALALALAMPLISIWTTLAALLGGMLAADVALGISPSFFLHALPAAVDAANLALAVGKTTVFGLLIALIACHFGLRIEPNTESLGKGTTAAVVTSITVVILVDALIAIVFKDIGT
jgi:phospholipid/cholesterol/gamma-HCH transport system permease protein